MAKSTIMRFGRHTDAVQEVVQFVRARCLLRRTPNDPIPSGIEMRFKPQEPIDLMYKPPDHPNIPAGYLMWFDIRQNESAEFFCHPSTEKFRRELFDVIDRFGPAIERDLPSDFLTDRDVIAGWIAEDLKYIAQGRAVFGRKESLFERMFQCYQCGGYPCGWRGNFPEGQMLVYFSNSIISGGCSDD